MKSGLLIALVAVAGFGFAADVTRAREEAAAGIALQQRAEQHRALGRLDQAEADARQAVTILDRSGPEYQIAASDAMQGLGLIRLLRGDLGEAQQWLRRAMQSLPEGDPRVAATLAGMAGVHLQARRYADSEQLLHKAIAMWETNPNASPRAVAAAWNNLAQIAKLTARWSEADTLYRRTLEQWEQATGRDSVEYALTLSNYADLYRATGKLSGAERMYHEALGTLKARLGPGDQRVINIEANLRTVASSNHLKQDHTVSIQSLRQR